MRNAILDHFCSKFPTGWTTERIGDCLTQIIRPIRMKDSGTYRLVSIRRRNGGMFDRQRLKGREILTKDLQEVVPDSFAIARRQIVHGACAYVGPEFADAAVSSSYSIFGGTDICEARYFSWLAQHPLMYAYFTAASHGIVIEKMNFDQDRWLAFPVPMPPIAEQRRITEILDSVDEAIRSTKFLVAKLERIERAFTEGLVSQPMVGTVTSPVVEQFESAEIVARATWPVRRLGDLLVRIEAGKSPDVPDRPANHDEWGVLKVSAIRSQGFDEGENKVVTQQRLRNKRIEVRTGDLLISRANTPELVGMACYVAKVRPGLMLSDKTLRLVVDSNKAVPEFLAHAMATHSVRRQIETSGTGSSGSMKNISQEEIRSLLVPYPPPREQRIIVARLQTIRSRTQVERQRLVKLSSLKRGLVENLLMGQVRVNTWEEAPA